MSGIVKILFKPDKFWLLHLVVQESMAFNSRNSINKYNFWSLIVVVAEFPTSGSWKPVEVGNCQWK